MAESVFDKKSRVRPPRVHITYEVETGGAMVMKEIPFVMGVLADLAGDSKAKVPKLKDTNRKFTDIDRDNFDDVLKSMKPRLAMRVENTLKDDGSELAVEVNFEKLADFRPENVVGQVKPLSDLQDIRNQLKDLLGRMEGNDRLEELLASITDNESVRDKLKDVLGAAAPSDDSGDAGEEG
ncbi:MAG: type VI secretion system contractile sheath small subunit [Deltaproteobacteria bacterium]|nr:type VI secretion system contractile sheath small subunit [Deltaproteobacteria bacterium]MBW2414163.1 type VI secretion system contractile sheath small subunit [Deltaproteobacteria bacterium]